MWEGTNGGSIPRYTLWYAWLLKCASDTVEDIRQKSQEAQLRVSTKRRQDEYGGGADRFSQVRSTTDLGRSHASVPVRPLCSVATTFECGPLNSKVLPRQARPNCCQTAPPSWSCSPVAVLQLCTRTVKRMRKRGAW